MRKTFLFILALCATMMAWGTPKSGLSEDGKTYYIASKTDLEGFRDAVNGGKYSLNAIQTADINFGMTSGVWDGSWQVPIGTTDAKAYTGTYDGQGYTISNFLIYYHENVDTQLKTYLGIGLFGVVKGATLKNIHITCATENKFEGNPADMKVKGCGILCGQMQDATLIEDCSVEGGAYISTASNAAILCGNDAGSKNNTDNKSTINRCWVSGALRIGRKGNFGGILGYAYNVSITNCYNIGTLDVIRDYAINAGGVLGYGNASSGPRVIQLSNCYNYGAVTDGRAAAGKTTKETVTLGAIAGNDKSSSYASVSNLYFLTGSCASAGSGIVSSAVSKSASEFKSLAASLGDEFVDGTDYPVFAKLTPALAFETSEFNVNTQEKSIENALSGLVEGAYPNFGTLSYKMTGDAIGTLVDGTANVTLNGTTGTATVTASVIGSNYYEEAETSYTITVVSLPAPLVTFPDLTDNKKTVNMDAVPFTENISVKVNGEEVPEPTITYENSNENVALVNETTGEVTIIGAGETTITAKVVASTTYVEADASYTLTVENNTPAEGTYWIEDFSNFKADGYTGYTPNIAGDYGITWTARNFRHKTSDDNVGGKCGVRLKYNASSDNKDAYIETNSLEGGVKRLQFKWKTPENSANPKFTVEFDNKATVYTVDQEQAAGDAGKEYDFGYNANIAKNAKFTIRVTSGTCASIIGPLYITPYLFYTEKEQTHNFAESTTLAVVVPQIDNRDNDNAITYSYENIEGEQEDIVSIEGTTITALKVGKTKIVATWGEVTTSYTLTISMPSPTITFNDFDVDLDGTVTPDITVMLNEEDITETATISYEVADKNIATWDATNGWKLKTNGTTQVTAKVEVTESYGAASATATMTVNAMTFADGTFFTENFGGEATSGYSTKTENWRGKDNVYPWTFLNWRRYADHVRITMTKPESSNINGYIYMNPFDDGALEGGIKAVQVIWKAPGASSLATDFYVDDMKHSDATKVVIQKEAGTISGQQITQAIFNSKTNAAQLRIRIGSLDKSAIAVYSVDIVPYLLYTKKEVPVTYDLEGTNEVDVTENLINNLEEDEKKDVTYTLSEGAQATIDGSIITLANVDETITVTAKWGEVSTTFTLKVTKTEEPVVEPDFILENKTAGAYATICLPNKIDHVENATLYSINYGTTQEIEFVEADLEKDKAGMPYLVQVAADGNVNFYYGEGTAVTEPVSAEDANGFVGSLQEEEQTIPSDGTAILVSGGQLRIAGAYCVLTKNHAYISTEYLPASAAPVGMRRTIRLYNAEVTTPTGWMDVNANANVGKIIRKGQLFIIREGKVYSAQGMLVK